MPIKVPYLQNFILLKFKSKLKVYPEKEGPPSPVPRPTFCPLLGVVTVSSPQSAAENRVQPIPILTGLCVRSRGPGTDQEITGFKPHSCQRCSGRGFHRNSNTLQECLRAGNPTPRESRDVWALFPAPSLDSSLVARLPCLSQVLWAPPQP